MNDTRITVALENREIILIGTAHVSRESIEEVNQIIREDPPDMVCVELDAGRYKSIADKEHWETLDLARILKEGKGFLLIANLILSGFQRRLGTTIGVKPGEEMKTAIETAQELGIPYAFCDREVQTTLRRAWARCSLWSKCKLLASLLSSAFSSEKLSEEEIENMKKRNELEGMMSELADYLPEVKATLIDERDRYLAAKIWTSTGDSPSGTIKKQVAVVGAGHLLGIKAHLEKISAGEIKEDVSDLDVIPPSGGISKAAGWIIPILIVLFIGLGFFQVGPAVSLEMLLRWVLLNGSLAALGALIALGHPLSIIVSFIGAPIGTISPFIAVGFFSGLTEVTLRKPRVSDTETISDDIVSLKGLYRNRITKALLVFFLSSVGGAIGNFISIPSLASLLIK
ncbi:MAG: TraB/GumN family protein [Treponema sp.]|jgi:pheromone shutdown-related protein TraB|nr:TraB/GumN family protein [Treponema sp.]